jgi:hypothetical protein
VPRCGAIIASVRVIARRLERKARPTTLRGSGQGVGGRYVARTFSIEGLEIVRLRAAGMKLWGVRSAAACVMAVAALLISQTPSAPVYDPYPPGILPSDLNSEIARVWREIAFIEKEAIAAWHTSPRPMLTGQPPTLQGAGYRAGATPRQAHEFRREHVPVQE